MWTCTLLFSYLADMLRTPPCQRRAWHVQPCIISVIGIGPFYSRTWRTWQTLQGKKKKKKAAIVIAPNEFFPSRRKAACVGLTGKPMVSKRSQLETEWQVNTRQPHGRSRCWSPGLSHLTTYGADGKCWGLTWTDRSWWGQICTGKPPNIFLYSPSVQRSRSGAVLCIYHL